MRSTTHPGIGVGITIVLVATVCLAGYWEFEQVDSGSIGSYVAIDRMSDGTIWLAYVNRDSAIRLAHKDTAWEYEDLDTTMVRPGFPSWQTWPPFSFDVGFGDAIGIAGLGRLAERGDSGWLSEVLPMPMTDVAFTYDLNGQPSLTFTDSLGHGCLGVRTDSGWDTSVVFIPQGYPSWFSLTRPCWRQHGNCAFMAENFWGDLIQEYRVWLLKRDSGIWTSYGLAGGLDGSGCVFATLADSSDSIHTFWSAGDNYFTNKLIFDAESLDEWTDIGAGCLDTAGRVQCTWLAISHQKMQRDGMMKFALVPEQSIDVVAVNGLSWCDITTDALSQPAIAYCTSDGSIYVAHGIDVAGLSSKPQDAAVRVSDPEASMVRGVLVLGAVGPSQNTGNRAELLDISGRKVMEPHPGVNDISRIAPGVYFVREALVQAASSKLRAVRKIVVTR
jgi:hypothetical protein